MIVSDIKELEVREVFDRGVPNLERVAIFVKEPVDLGRYGIMVGIKENRGSALPIRDHLFWFGDGLVQAGDWIYIYTGAGEGRVSTIPGSSSSIYAVHWGKNITLFHAPELVPILFRVDAVFVPQERMQLPKPEYA